MRIEEINRDRDKFLEHVQNSLEPELKKIGLVLINVNITDITDEAGYIDAIGQKAASHGHSAGPRRRGRAGEDGREPRGRGRARQVDPGGQRHTRLSEIGTREAAREQAVRVADAGEGAEGRRADRRPSSARRRSRLAEQADARAAWPRPTPRRSTAKTSPRP